MFKKMIPFLTAFLLMNTVNLFANGPGDKVEDFTLKNYDGTSYTLSDGVKNSKAVVIMFWSAECPYVQGYNDRIQDLANEYNKKGFVFWAINSNSTESITDVEAHAKKNKYPFPVLKDQDNIVADKLGATRTPEVFVIDMSMTVLYHGRIDDNRNSEKVTTHDLRNTLNEITAGKDVSVKETKSFGCTIKRVEK